MWGKLNQMVSGDQQKIEALEAELQEEQQRTKMINDQFKKVLKEKEKEIAKLKSSLGSSAADDGAAASPSGLDVSLLVTLILFCEVGQIGERLRNIFSLFIIFFHKFAFFFLKIDSRM